MAHQSCFCKSTNPTLRKWPSQHWRRSASRANKSAVSIWKVRAVQHLSASRALKMSQTRFQVYRFGDFICFIVECAYFDVLLFLLLGCSCFFTVTIVCTCILILIGNAHCSKSFAELAERWGRPSLFARPTVQAIYICQTRLRVHLQLI